MNLKQALEKMLLLAEQKLEFSLTKDDEWGIEHYKKDIEYIKSELEIVNKKRS